MKNIKAVIFDMDGLIVDTEIIESRSLETLLLKYGKTPIYQENGLVHVVGRAENSYRDLIEQYKITEDYDKFRNKKREIFAKLLDVKLTPFQGFFELIKLLLKQNMQIALASNRYEKHIHIILENLGVKDHFSVIVGPSETRRHKPHPDIYLDTAKGLGVKPEECVVLEDSETGILSAKAAGMKVIAIPNKYTEQHNFEKADIITKSLVDVDMQLLNSL